MKRAINVGYADGDQILSRSQLDSGLQIEIDAIANFNGQPGAARKGIHSIVIEDGWGTEIAALFSGHGTNATLPGSVYSLAPLTYYLDVGTIALDAVYRKAGVDELLSRLCRRWDESGGVPAIDSLDDSSDDIDELETAELPGVSSLPYPPGACWTVFNVIAQKANGISDELTSWSRDDLLRALMLQLLQSGIPLKNLRRYRKYYRTGSFICVDGTPRFFAALIAQSDGGLGLVVTTIRHPEVVASILDNLKRFGPLAPRTNIFSDFEMSDSSLRSFVERRFDLNAAEHKIIAAHTTSKTLDRSATFIAVLKLGGFLAAALRDQMLSAPNYYHVGDLLRLKGICRSRLTTLDHQPWEDPYSPTPTQRKREVDTPVLVGLLNAATEPRRGRGRPRQLPKAFAELGAYVDWSDRIWGKLVGHYWPQPSRARIRRLLLDSGACSDAVAWKRANRIYQFVAADGKLASAPPQRLIDPQRVAPFLQRTETFHLPAAVASRRTCKRLTGLMYSLATVGCRTHEGCRIARDDFTRIFGLSCLSLRGTKTHRAKREPLTKVFVAGLENTDVFGRWEMLVNEACIAHGGPLFGTGAGKRDRADKLNEALQAAFNEELRTSGNADRSEHEGRFTSYSLRRVTVLRLIQAAIDDHFLHGHFLAAISSVAAALGHSLAVCLSHYLGTAAVVLTWPTIIPDIAGADVRSSI